MTSNSGMADGSTGPVAAIVLTGGGSRRMGRDKASLELDGRPLLAWVVEVLAVRCAAIVISARPGRALPELPELRGVELVRVDDPVVDAGPVVGVDVALAWLAARGYSRAYLGSGDAAGLSDRHVGFMLAQLDANPRAIAAVPVDPDGRRHPLAAAVAVAGLQHRARAQLDAGDPRLQSLLSGAGIVEVPAASLPDPEVLEPCNTPDQWAAALSRRREDRRS